MGPVVSDFIGWHIKPKNGVVSNVTARLRVRADWINFEDVDYVNPPGKWRRRIEDLLKPERSARRQRFQILLRHLAQTELKEHQSDLEATIAAAVLVVKPTEQYPTSVATGNQRREIRIPSEPIERFLDSEVGYEAGTMIGLGVRRDQIPVDKPEQGRKRGKRTFVPESSPVNVAGLYAKVRTDSLILDDYRKADVRLPNELRDLRSLGLLTRDYELPENTPLHLPPEIHLRRTVSETPSIRVARAVLRANPNASAHEISDAVALELGKDWSLRSTKQRNGGAIRRWTIWLEPHLIDASSSGEAAALVAYAMEDTAAKGRPRNPQVEEEAIRLIREGVTAAEVARHFKISTGVLYLWRKKHGLTGIRRPKKR